MSASFEMAVQGDLEAARVARDAIAASDPTLAPLVREDLSLLVTELVTNAVLHGGAATDRPLQVELRRQNGRIRVEVIDPGTGFEQPSPPTNGDWSSGWGLFLVDRIAASWGVSPAPAGTCVWFELSEPRPAPVPV
jgi:anti-sigma regulatory factor (Ser/Thr protein kinase)